MLELYHSINSVCAQKIRIALHEKGLTAKDHIIDVAWRSVRSRLYEAQSQRRGADLDP